MAAAVALLALLLASSAVAQWPDCITQGEDNMGFDVLNGHRFSAEGCAHWCSDLSGCESWVYKEDGQMCHLKATDGERRDETNPLLPEDRAALNITHSDPIAATTPGPDGVFDAHLDALLVQRKEELERTYSGPKACISTIKLPWHDCAILGQTIDDTHNVADAARVGYISEDKEHCSDDCAKDDSCAFWTYHEQARTCTWKTSDADTAASDNMWYGSSECSGLVEEGDGDDTKPIDGNWSPWSKFQTPCIDKKTGDQVTCGGGVHLRHRSCSDPEPRYGGKVCPGEDYDEYPCNTNACQLDGDFAWSEWSAPDVLCAEGIQTRTTLCGAWRRRLPPEAGRDPDEPAVKWPTCMVPRKNSAAPVENAKDMLACANDCKGDDDCKFWTYDLANSKCTWHKLMEFDSYLDSPDFVTGEKFCSASSLPAPYCGEFQANYAAAPNVDDSFAVEEYDECAEACMAKNAGSATCLTDDTTCPCQNWYLKIDIYGVKTCQLRGAKSGASTAMSEPETWYFFGSKDCQKKEVVPAFPEDAEHLAYKEVCKGDQYDFQTRVNNTWSKENCPSPCYQNGPCPRHAECIDLSDDVGPKYECQCQLGLFMEGGQCVNLPKTTPTPRPQPTLAPALKDTSTAVKTATCVVLIVFLIVTLLMFGFFRIFNPGRFIHMNIELSLLLAHICLVCTPGLWEHESTCRNLSIAIHFFFTAAFAFFVVEAIYAYSMVSYVVRRNGMLSNVGNVMVGWGIPVTVVAFTVSFEYDSYGGDYHCWLDMETGLIYGQYVPIVVLGIIAVMLVEAGGNINENTMRKLADTDAVALKSAQYMLSTLFLRLGLTFASFAVGTIAEYNQNFGLYLIFSITNAVLGGVIFITHCFCNETVRAKLNPIFGKWCCCCPTPEDDEDDPENPSINDDENNTLVEDVDEDGDEDEEDEEEEEEEQEDDAIEEEDEEEEEEGGKEEGWDEEEDGNDEDDKENEDEA